MTPEEFAALKAYIDARIDEIRADMAPPESMAHGPAYRQLLGARLQQAKDRIGRIIGKTGE